MPERQIVRHMWITCAMLAVLSLLATSIDLPGKEILLKEGGVVESASAVGYLFCAGFFLYKGGTAFLKRYHYMFILIVTFMLRELDFDKRFWTMGILKSRFLTSDSVPLGEKIIGGAIILLLVYAVLSAILLQGRNFSRELKERSAVGLGIAIALGLLVVSKSLDGLARKLHGIGVEIGGTMSSNASTVEEILELGIPVFIFFALQAYFSRKHRKIISSQETF